MPWTRPIHQAFLLPFMVAVCLHGLVAAPISAQESPQGDTERKALEYRQYLVPEGNKEDYIRDGYMPLARQRFDEFVRNINRQSAAGSERSTRLASWTTNSLTARLAGR
jgi:hypothetical protein